MKKILQLFLTTFLLLNLLSAQSDLEKALYDLPDIRFEKIKTPDGFESAYLVNIKQPLDHTDPSKGHFYQRVWFSHSGFDKPTVINTAGYHCKANRIYEPTKLLNANQLRVEHRFFGTSIPENMEEQYQYLNMEQATADLHKVREVFGQLYKNKWLATGISKGGMTTIYYKYFYPNDVDVSIPYVAPIDTTFEDPRIYDFLNNQGSVECRTDIREVQDRMLADREEAMVRLKWHSKGKGYTFDYLGFERAYEYSVLEYPFSFWQMGNDCKKIPAPDVPMDDLIEYFNEVVGMGLFSDQEIKTYGSHYYQAATQTGYYGYETKPFGEALKASPEKPHAAFIPNKMPFKYDNTLSKKVYKWATTKGDNMVYIYGNLDTWTAAGVPKSKQPNSIWFFMDGKAHGDARIKNMNQKEHKKLIKHMEKWLDMEIEEKARP